MVFCQREEGVLQMWLSRHTRGAPHVMRAATITNLPVAFEVVKAMQAGGLEMGRRVSAVGPTSPRADHRGADGRAVGVSRPDGGRRRRGSPRRLLSPAPFARAGRH